jgi:20S proteasome subunit alpha 6
MESVKQGSACVGLRSNKAVVLGAFKRSVSELSSYQKKLMEIDSHLGVGIAGLTADARSLVKYMQSECLNHKYIYGSPIPPTLLVADLADKHQRTTQTYVRRPFGVGLLLAAVDAKDSTPHLYQTCPSGNLYEFYASAIGARSQSARTYFEKHWESMPTCSDEQLILHALQALVGCVSGDTDLTTENSSIVIVGGAINNGAYTLIEGAALQPYLDQIENKSAAAVASDSDEEVADAPEEESKADDEAMET